MITNIVKITLRLSFIKIYCILLKSNPEIFTKMRHNVFPCRFVFTVLSGDKIIISGVFGSPKRHGVKLYEGFQKG
jgi:hypothetical protein